MEKRRQELMRQKRSWGDSATCGDAKTGKLTTGLLDHCLATYKAAAAQLDASAQNPIHPLISTEPKHISARGWSIDNLIASHPNFKPVRRISAFTKAALNPTELERYDKEGKPVIIENFHKYSRWPQEFNLEWFKTNGPSNISVRNVIDGSDQSIPISDFIDKCRAASPFAVKQEQARLYGKDLECPKQWRDALIQSGIPKRLLPGNVQDFLTNQPSKGRVETLMCYMGIGDTFTPCHKDLCASSGQNLMCYTENDGSSFWFMTATEDVFNATSYFHSINNELDHENHFIGIEQLSKAPFTVYVAEQKLGDLVLVPSRSCHQVINQGGITIKTSWSRMTLDGLIAAYYHELPIYQRVCRPETYRIKHTIYHALLNNIDKLKHGGQSEQRIRTSTRSASAQSEPISLNGKRSLDSLQRLLEAYDEILLEEACHMKDDDKVSFVLDTPAPSSSTLSDTDDRIICDFCGADIFQSFLECRMCVKKPEQVTPGSGCVVCSRCYVDGRTCRCGSMNPVQCGSFDTLLKVRDEAVEVLKRCNVKQSIKSLTRDDLTTSVFAAACLKNRVEDPNVIVTCDNQGDAHRIRKHDSLRCAGCHKTSCFQHLLTKCDTHAVDALLDFEADQRLYHRTYHLSDPPRPSEQDVMKFAESVKRGFRPDLRFQRYHITAFHRKSLPESQYVRPGYYDEGWQPPDQILSRKNPESSSRWPLSVPEREHQIKPNLLPTTQKTLIEKPQRGRKRKRWVIDYIDLRLPAKGKPALSASGGLNVDSQTEPVGIRDHTLHAPGENSTLESNCDNGITSMEQPSVGASCSVEGEHSLSTQTTHASSAMEVDISGEDNQLGQHGDDGLTEVRVNEGEAAKPSDEGPRARESQTEKIATRKLGSKTKTTKASTRKQTKVQHGIRRQLVSRREPSQPSLTVDDAEGDRPQQNTELDQTLSDPPNSSAMVTPGPCAASVEPQSTESDTAVTDSDGHIEMSFSGIPIRSFEELPLNQSNSNPDKWKQANKDGTSGKKKIPTGPARRSVITNSALGSADEEPARPHKRLKAGKPSAVAKAQRQRRTRPEQRDEFVSQEQNGAPSVAEALNTASTANQTPPRISRTRKSTQTQVERDDSSPVQMQDSSRHQEERRHPSLTPQSKEEYEKKIHNLESRLAAAEARDPSKMDPYQMMDQLSDVLFRRMKEVMPPAAPPQVYVTPIAVGPEGPFFMPPGASDAYGYRGNHVGTSHFPSRGPPSRRFSPHQTDPYWRSPNPNNTRPEYRNRPPNMHHNNGNFGRGQSYRGGFQRGGRRYGDYYNRERHNGTLELNQRTRSTHQWTASNDAYRSSGDAISEVGSSDQHHRDHHGGDAMNGIEHNEAYQQHSREPSPYEQTAGTSNGEAHGPPATHFMDRVGNADAGSELHGYDQANRQVNSSVTMSPVRPELDPANWEDNYEQEGDLNNKGDGQVRLGALNETNPWAS